MQNACGRPRCRWNENIKMNLKQTGCEDVDYIQLAQGTAHWWALVNTLLNFLVP